MAETISVFARLRPLNAREEAGGEGASVRCASPEQLRVVSGLAGCESERSFRFERAFDEASSQSSVFAGVCAPSFISVDVSTKPSLDARRGTRKHDTGSSRRC